MAIVQTELASGKLQAPQNFTSGSMSSYLAQVSVTAANGDIVELGPLPVGCRLVSAKLLGGDASNLGGLGLMSGDAGSQDQDRTIDVEITEGEEYTILPEQYARGIGAVASEAITPDSDIFFEVVFVQL
jgi:hypothetical protein